MDRIFAMKASDFKFDMQARDGCPLCGSTMKKEYTGMKAVDGGTAMFQQCAECRLLYLDPAPTKESVEFFYRQIYSDPEFRKLDGHSHADPVKEFVAGLPVFERHLDFIEQHKQPPGKMLDVGCSYGGILVEAASRGWRTEGIEPSMEAVKFCREKLGLNVTRGGIMDTQLQPGSVDVVVMLEVIEHLEDPVAALKKTNELARASSMLYLTSPNASSAAAMVLGSNWIGWKPPTHLQFFSYGTLPVLLEKTGWRPVKIKSGGGYPGQIMAVARKSR